MVACYYGLTSYLLALCPSLLSFGFLLLIWPKGQAELFSATPSTNAKRKAILAELCAVIYIICAASSLFFRFRSENLSSEVSLLLLRKQALTTIWKLDLGASLAIVLAHMTGHHDICDRIHRRLLRLALALHVTCWSMYVVCYDALQDLPKDLEDQRNLCQESLIDFTDAAGDPALATPLIPSPATVDFMPSEQQIQKINDVGGMTNGDGTDLVRKYPLMRRLSSDPYEAVHQGFRSMGAQVRWSSLRYRLRIQRLPLREFLLFVASRVQSDRLEVELGYSNASPTPVQFLPIKPRPIGNHPPLFTSVVMDILHQQPHNGHDGQRWHPLRLSEELQSLDKGKHGNLAPPIFQLPGTIQNINIKALPDTGSSQNVIDQYLVQNLSPPVLIQPVEINVDKPLVAPDGELIPFVGKVHLHWMFKHGHKVYKKWFYVVPGCSHGVIIGNGFLQETETMSKHQDRLEITEPIEPDPLVGNLVSEAQQDDCLHQIVRGTINGKPAESSLDTGCQANLMSLDYANRLDLSLLTTSVGSQLVKFADGRKRPTLGQVEIDWSFADTPEKVVAVRCHVLPTCIHPVIFGDRFVLSEKPWEKHDSSLHQIPSSTADIGPVGLYRSPFPWLGHKPGMSLRL